MLAPAGVDSESSDEDEVSPITSASPSPTRAKFSFKSLFVPPKLSTTPPLPPKASEAGASGADIASAPGGPSSDSTMEKEPHGPLQRLKRRVRILAKGDDKPTTNKGESVVEEAAAQVDESALAGNGQGGVEDEEKEPAAVEMLSLLRQLMAQQAKQEPPTKIDPLPTPTADTPSDLSSVAPTVEPKKDAAAKLKPPPARPPLTLPLKTNPSTLSVPAHNGASLPTFNVIPGDHAAVTPGLNDTYFNPTHHPIPTQQPAHPTGQPSGSDQQVPPQQVPPQQGWQPHQPSPQHYPGYGPPQAPYHMAMPPPMYPHPSVLQPWHPSNQPLSPHIGYQNYPPYSRYPSQGPYSNPPQTAPLPFSNQPTYNSYTPYSPTSPSSYQQYAPGSAYPPSGPRPLWSAFPLNQDTGDPNLQRPYHPQSQPPWQVDPYNRPPWSPASPLANPWQHFDPPDPGWAAQPISGQPETQDGRDDGAKGLNRNADQPLPKADETTQIVRSTALSNGSAVRTPPSPREQQGPNDPSKSARTAAQAIPTRTGAPPERPKRREAETGQERAGDPMVKERRAPSASEGAIVRRASGQDKATPGERAKESSRSTIASETRSTRALTSSKPVQAEPRDEPFAGMLTSRPPQLVIGLAKTLAAGKDLPSAFEAVLGDKRGGEVFAKELNNVAGFIAHSHLYHGEVPEGKRGVGKGEASTPSHGIVQLLLSNDKLHDTLQGWPIAAYLTPGVISIVKDLAVRWKDDDLSLKVILRSVLAIRQELEHPSRPHQLPAGGLLDQLAVVLSKQLKHQSTSSRLPSGKPAPASTPRPPVPQATSRPEPGRQRSTTPKDPPPLERSALKPQPITAAQDSSDSAYSASEPESPGTLESDEEAEMMLGMADSGPPAQPRQSGGHSHDRPRREQVQAAKEVLMR
ncbi:uncharacterized protein MKK02DRAFT_31672 [Dioszegia hungarica]|uniref:Uncharacterized protein n=1 Tax=Dioszegia hungarica TaxID=4972 RepID=A0AA38HCR1_9TREE|nr:uncharacterized protein MKK02DRAFT_31672 [Dioszegia hungarica]KAI9638185.1 hypothetical protein MKK02DRAFT_31672 [Dioszegia hungarica]